QGNAAPGAALGGRILNVLSCVWWWSELLVRNFFLFSQIPVFGVHGTRLQVRHLSTNCYNLGPEADLHVRGGKVLQLLRRLQINASAGRIVERVAGGQHNVFNDDIL